MERYSFKRVEDHKTFVVEHKEGEDSLPVFICLADSAEKADLITKSLNHFQKVLYGIDEETIKDLVEDSKDRVLKLLPPDECGEYDDASVLWANLENLGKFHFEL